MAGIPPALFSAVVDGMEFLTATSAAGCAPVAMGAVPVLVEGIAVGLEERVWTSLPAGVAGGGADRTTDAAPVEGNSDRKGAESAALEGVCS